MNKFDRAMFVLPGMPKLAKTAMLGVAAVVISGCATTAQMPVAPMQADRVETLLDAHAERAAKAWRELADLEQGMAQVAANRNAAMAGDLPGFEDLGDDDFYGQSYFVDPEGSYVGDKGDPYKPELIVRDLDLDLLTEVRNRWQFYRDRRPDAYDDLVRP